jgi:hypothetical protein
MEKDSVEKFETQVENLQKENRKLKRMVAFMAIYIILSFIAYIVDRFL